ncbi:MAG: hypothetical protein R3B90_14845 [Planctomycetaceae bacterium]
MESAQQPFTPPAGGHAAPNAPDGSTNESVEWVAMRYLLDELSAPERAAFESRLEHDMSACEALADAVQLRSAVCLLAEGRDASVAESARQTGTAIIPRTHRGSRRRLTFAQGVLTTLAATLLLAVSAVAWWATFKRAEPAAVVSGGGVAAAGDEQHREAVSLLTVWAALERESHHSSLAQRASLTGDAINDDGFGGSDIDGVEVTDEPVEEQTSAAESQVPGWMFAAVALPPLPAVEPTPGVLELIDGLDMIDEEQL